MVLLSSPVLLRSHALTLLVSAYYLLTSPLQLLSASPIWLLGESMSIRPASFAALDSALDASNTKTNLKSLISGASSSSVGAEKESFALVGLLLVFYAGMMALFAGDLTIPSSSSFGQTDGGNAPAARSAARFAEEIHTLLTAQSKWLTLSGLHVLGSSILVGWIYLFHSHNAASQSLPSTSLSGFSLLANRVTFTAALVDMLFWGYLWTVLKEEGREVGKTLARRREVKEQDED